MKQRHEKSPTNGKVSGTAPPALEPLRERIAARAYAVFLGRGGEHGHAEEDWLEAERQITTEIQQS